MDNFDRCENIGRHKFESLLQQKGITDYYFTKDKYCPVDCFFTSPTQDKWVVEIKVRDEGVDKYSTLFMELAKWKEMDAIIKSKQADQGMYVNFIGDKCYIFCFSQIHPSFGCRLKDVYANRHTATNDGKRWKKMIEIPKVLSLDMSDYKNPQLS